MSRRKIRVNSRNSSLPTVVGESVYGLHSRSREATASPKQKKYIKSLCNQLDKDIPEVNSKHEASMIIRKLKNEL